MRWLLVGCIVVLMCLALPQVALAGDGDTDTITITSTGVGTFPITDFVVSITNYDKVSSQWIDTTGNWGFPADTDYVVIYRSFNDYPNLVGIGTLVYNGTGDSFSETITGMIGTVYYSAWTHGGEGYSEAVNYSLEVKPKMVSAIMFFALISLGGILTGLSGWKRFLLMSMAASIAWLVLGILLMTSPDTIGLGSLSATWTQALGFVFILMVFSPVLLYIKPTTTLQREETMRDAFGRPIKTSWTEQGSRPKSKQKRSDAVQSEYKERLRKRTKKK
jgi:hypothetical protein